MILELIKCIYNVQTELIYKQRPNTKYNYEDLSYIGCLTRSLCCCQEHQEQEAEEMAWCSLRLHGSPSLTLLTLPYLIGSLMFVLYMCILPIFAYIIVPSVSLKSSISWFELFKMLDFSWNRQAITYNT